MPPPPAPAATAVPRDGGSPLPPRADGELPGTARRALVLGVLGAHAAAAWGLLHGHALPDTPREAAPLQVELLVATPPAPALPPSPPPPPPPPPPTPPAPPPAPRPPRPALRKPPPPAPLAAAPAPSPEPPAYTAPPPPPAPPPETSAPAPAPAVAAAPAPAPAPAPPAEPRTLPATAVQYLTPPAPVYPRASRRHGESGRVTLRVLIDEQGRPAELRVQSSSGFPRLDEAALAALREARFRPYAENGLAQRVWALVPIHFDLEN